ncbi:MAG: argininosuccinate lyase [Dictyoglomus turgidum]|uniref:argininosuccinate lyase n=1 Tax=Dictyoglomus turgidum TaxID=513050 RepID=UPI003C70EC20
MALWGSRWRKPLDKTVEDFTYSLDFDKRLWKADLTGTLAHVIMLNKIGVISEEELKTLKKEIKNLYLEILNNPDLIRDSEDVHTFIEENLTKKIGDIGKKIHTGRSRNDQVVLDLRLYLKEEACNIAELLIDLRKVLFDLSEKFINVPMPGYTHLQQAQPVTLAHYFLAYDAMFSRDLERLEDIYKRIDVMPLGSGALAGSNIPLDREYTAKLLRFSKISDNSMDAVSDRDFVLEFLFFSALVYTHLSRLAEEIILWSTKEFSFIRLPEEYSTGSSMMPQKRNPDVAELTRGKTGKVIGNLVNMFTVVKGLPLSYNRDLQEDKPSLFSSVDELKITLKVWTGFLSHIEFNIDGMYRFSSEDFLFATDIAEYLVLKGMPFREAHKVVGEIVRFCEENNKKFRDLSLEDWRRFSDLFDESVFSLLTPESSLKFKKTYGSPNPDINREVIKKRREEMKNTIEKWNILRNNSPDLAKLLEGLY